MSGSNAAGGWAKHLLGGLKVAVIAFVVLQIKELKDAGRFDTVGTAIDGGLIGAGSIILDAVLGALKRGRGASPASSASTS
jgi:hypothetical protein